MKNIVVFASGSGTNFQSIIDAIEHGKITARISGLIANKSGIGAIEKAHNSGIPYFVFSPSDYPSSDDYSNALLEKLQDLDTDLIVLAGYLKKIPSSVVQHFSGRILNIHPALLPKFGGKGFYGLNVHKAVIDSGDKKSGCSVHVVTENFDEGPVLAQIKVPVKENDSPESLAKRILEKEHILYPKVIQQFLSTL